MLHGHTIALAENLIERDRVRDAFRMLDALPLAPADDPGVLIVRTLLARIRLFTQDAPHLALQHIEPAVQSVTSHAPDPWTEAHVRCWQGWTTARLSKDPAALRKALFALDTAARLAAAAYDSPLQTWAERGMAYAWARLGEPELAFAVHPDGLVPAPAAWAERAEAWIRDVTPASSVPEPHAKVPTVEADALPPYWLASHTMRAALRRLSKRRLVATPVLLVGERGTGKAALARLAHAAGPACAGPFHACDARRQSIRDIETAMEQALRPVEDAASDSRTVPTLFVNAPSGLDVQLQGRLAEIAAEGRIGLIWAEREPPGDLVRRGELDPRLAEAGSGLALYLPPLRDRRAEIRPLIDALLESHTPRAAITPHALRLLVAFDWPGNVRQLRNEIDRAVGLVRSEPVPVVGTAQIPPALRPQETGTAPADATDVALRLGPGFDLDKAMARAERSLLLRVLEQHGGNVTASAEALGLSRQGLYKKMHRLGIDPSAHHADTRPEAREQVIA